MFLGIDIGTSGVKAVLLDVTGTITAQATSPLAVSRLQPLWSEQDPADWWGATDLAVRSLDPALRSQVQAIGLSGQMHGAVLLGADDRPLRPAILWNDGRAHAECAELEVRVPTARTITGNIAMPGFTAPKLLWVARHEPAVFAKIAKVLLPKDYIRLWLTGDHASDMSDSAGTLWLDGAKRAWSGEMLAASGLTAAHMPTLYEGNQPTGTLRADIAAAWGIGCVPVAAGAGDNAAGAIGVGVVSEGEALLSLGTSGVIFVATDSFRTNPADAVHAFCHALPGMWHQMSVHLSAASCLDWAAQMMGLVDVPALLALAEGAEMGPELFLPYLSGERTPHNNPHIRGAFLNAGFESNPARVALAVLEGVAFALADGLAALRTAGTQVERLSVIGGGARSPFWGRIIAAALDVELDYISGGDIGPALGAARLARMALTGEDSTSVCTAPPVTATIAPDPALAAKLAPKYAAFRNAYPAIKSL